MSKYLNTYKIESSRLSTHDYSANAKYFITINTFRNQNYFGSIAQTRLGASQEFDEKIVAETHQGVSLRLTELGLTAQQHWAKLPDHFPFISLDEFVIMPNHIHGIIEFTGIHKTQFESNIFGSKKGSLGTIINLFKGGVKRYANNNNIDFRWHSRYYDRIIRDYEELNNVRNYIQQNPLKWLNRTDAPRRVSGI